MAAVTDVAWGKHCSIMHIVISSGLQMDITVSILFQMSTQKTILYMALILANFHSFDN
jgi:hypothetical protein